MRPSRPAPAGPACLHPPPHSRGPARLAPAQHHFQLLVRGQGGKQVVALEDKATVLQPEVLPRRGGQAPQVFAQRQRPAPLSGCSSPDRIASSVDLPLPEGPMTSVSSPRPRATADVAQDRRQGLSLAEGVRQVAAFQGNVRPAPWIVSFTATAPPAAPAAATAGQPDPTTGPARISTAADPGATGQQHLDVQAVQQRCQAQGDRQRDRHPSHPYPERLGQHHGGHAPGRDAERFSTAYSRHEAAVAAYKRLAGDGQADEQSQDGRPDGREAGLGRRHPVDPRCAKKSSPANAVTGCPAAAARPRPPLPRRAGTGRARRSSGLPGFPEKGCATSPANRTGTGRPGS